uniref:Uncharacterized protein n=1 Tax=Anopheles minimus TaxID=112268 RepID=A0A182WNL3_9DIPT
MLVRFRLFLFVPFPWRAFLSVLSSPILFFQVLLSSWHLIRLRCFCFISLSL